LRFFGAIADKWLEGTSLALLESIATGNRRNHQEDTN
jgi:hypothetical protein